VLRFTQPESEWDDENRDWALALQAADDSKCPVCGGPMSDCLDPASEDKWDVGPPVRCQRATVVTRKQKQHADDTPEGVDLQSRALIWGATRKP
jgi:hypothetical protein